MDEGERGGGGGQRGSVDGGASQRTSWSRPGARGRNGTTRSSFFLVPVVLQTLVSDQFLRVQDEPDQTAGF